MARDETDSSPTESRDSTRVRMGKLLARVRGGVAPIPSRAPEAFVSLPRYIPAMAATPKEHPITVTPNPNRVRVVFDGRVIADTTRALTMREGRYPPVQYIPREDATMASLQRTDHKTYCPYKGDCSYYSIRAEGRAAENAVWTYEQPYEGVAAIKG